MHFCITEIGIIEVGQCDNTEAPRSRAFQIDMTEVGVREDSQVEMTQPLAIELGLLHSRDYQTAFEDVYLNALQLSVNRFDFDTQWFGGAGLGFTATGSATAGWGNSV